MSADVLKGLKESSMGRLHYDPYWLLEGRTAEVLHGARSCQLDPAVLPSRFREDTVHVPGVEHDVDCDAPAEAKGTPVNELQNVTQDIDVTCNEIPIVLYEEERCNSIRESLLHRLAQQERELQRWQEQAHEHISAMQHSWLLEQQRYLDFLHREHTVGLQDMAEESRKIQEHNRNRAMYLKNKMREAELRQRQLDDERRHREESAQLLQVQCQELQQLLELCQDRLQRAHLTDAMKERSALLQHMVQEVSRLGASISAAASLEKLQKAMTSAQEMHSQAASIYVEIEAKAQAQTKAEAEAKERQKADITKAAASATATTSAAPTVEVPAKDTVPKSSIKKPLQGHWAQDSKDMLKHHTELLQRLDEWQSSYMDFVQDKAKKQYRFDLLKAVSVSVNALSSSSAVREKLDRLSALLSGKPFVLGSRSVTCSDHPSARRFCLDKLAERIVSQGEEQINCNGDSAYPVAALALGIWCRFPELGDLLLGHLYLRCPALVPLYPSGLAQPQPSPKLLRLYGYKMNEDGSFETDVQYQRRIGGFVRLYAAIVQTESEGPHPLGVDQGWRLLARTLNQKPQQPDIVATVLFNFLEVAGWAMGRAYGRQFIKLLHVLCKDYFPQLRGEQSSGPVARLEGLLQQVLRRGAVPRPEASLGDTPLPRTDVPERTNKETERYSRWYN